MEGPATVKELAEPFEMALPTVLQHMKKLETGGLIRTEKSGRVRTAHAEPQALEPAEGWIMEQKAMWNSRLDRLEAYLEKQKQKQKEGAEQPPRNQKEDPK